MMKKIVVALFVASMAIVGADTKLSRQQADAFSRKIGAITAIGVKSDKKRMLTRTQVTEGELNSWMVYSAKPLIPNGVAEPSVSILGDGKLSGRAIVDLDAVSKQKSSGGTFDPWRLLGGRVPVTAIGTLKTKDGVGQFELESAQASGLPVPKFLLQQLVSYYTKTSEHPEGVTLDTPFQLPANIRQIEVGQGTAVIVQ